MRIKNIDCIEPGSRLSKPVYGQNDQVLLQRGTILQPEYISRLKKLGYSYLYIENELVDDIIIHETISEKTRRQATRHLNQAVQEIKTFKTLRVAPLKKVVFDIVDEIIRNKDMMLSLSNISSHDEYTFNHSINATVTAIMMGTCMYYPHEKLHKLGLGVLLHDIGKINIPLDILNKPDRLTGEEFELVKKHAWNGFEMLRSNPEISITSAHVAFQHHERYNGTGYPRGLKKNEIIEFARIAAIADVYDAMTSDRCYRKRLAPDQVYRFLLENAESAFDPYILDRFVQKIAVYPQGTMVRLSNGNIGVVIKQNSLSPQRPFVRVFYRPDGTELAKPVEVNLLLEENLFIRQVVEEKPRVQKY